ncbi:putative isomerase YbhE [Tothia fuscella]|uniref:Isomerase YbhE n=1 Tax=Tothia fuscella TaxID=1048955 RepID=A0A9P4NGR4_9PEZI|nr:putative isomerase YbhE [Tothia fuscella]
MSLAAFLLLALRTCGFAAAVNIYVASYSGGSQAGNITTLSLLRNPDESYSLSQTATVNTSTNSPSWLTLSRQNNLLYMVDEAINGTANSKGALVVYRTSYSGKLTEVSRTEALIGGVDATFFANGQALVVPHYTGGNLQSYNIDPKGGVKPIETIYIKSRKSNPGPIVQRQEAPHPHQAILDPTRSFILIPDLGDDEVHVFAIDQETHKLTKKESLQTKLGVGPRHGVFTPDLINGKYVFYLVGELTGDIKAYSVTYKPDNGGISFDEVASYAIVNPGVTYPRKQDGSSHVAPAEIDITADGSTLVLSIRNDTTFGTAPPVDSLVHYSISPVNGTLTQKPLVSAYGSFPRHFAINKAGNLMVVPSQLSGKLVILRKNPKIGVFDEKVASVEFAAGANVPVCAVWDE